WAEVPEVEGFGFVVFKLRSVEPRSLFARLLGQRSVDRTYHPMAFWFPRRDMDRLFFPTLHIHDGRVHPEAEFDHVLYAQASSQPSGWDASQGSLRERTWGPTQSFVADAPGYRLRIV